MSGCLLNSRTACPDCLFLSSHLVSLWQGKRKKAAWVHGYLSRGPSTSHAVSLLLRTSRRELLAAVPDAPVAVTATSTNTAAASLSPGDAVHQQQQQQQQQRRGFFPRPSLLPLSLSLPISSFTLHALFLCSLLPLFSLLSSYPLFLSLFP